MLSFTYTIHFIRIVYIIHDDTINIFFIYRIVFIVALVDDFH